MRRHSIGIGTFLLAAFGLLWLRGLALYASEHPNRIPDWLNPLLEGTGRVQNSALSFDEFLVDFGTVLEGKQLQHEFSFTNQADTPVTILKARKCSCVTTEFPEDPIAAGATATIETVMDTRDRTGPQIKEIVLFTDEDDDSRVSVVLKADIRSPLVLRKKNLLLTRVPPGAKLEEVVDVSVSDDATNLSIRQTGDFFAATLDQVSANEAKLRFDLTAPEENGTVRGEVVLGCDLPEEPWARSFPVWLTVSTPFQVIPSRLSLRQGKGTIRVKELWPQDSPLETARSNNGALTVTETDRNNLITLEVEQRDPGQALPENTRLLLFAAGNDEPVAIEVVAKD